MPSKYGVRPTDVETHSHNHGSWGFGPPCNSRVCVLCRPEDEIESHDLALGKKFQKRKNPSLNATICALLQSEERFRYKFTAEQVAALEQLGPEKLRDHWTRKLKKRLKFLLKNDMSQSPMRKHALDPAFFNVALCCRYCVEKWYGIPRKKVLTNKKLKEMEDLAMHYLTEFIFNKEHSKEGNQTVRDFMIAEYPTSNAARYNHRAVRLKKEGKVHVVVPTGKEGVVVDYAKHRERKGRKRKAEGLGRIKVKKEKTEAVGRGGLLQKIGKSRYVTVDRLIDRLETHYIALMSRREDPERALEAKASELGVSVDDLRPLLNERFKNFK